MFYKNKSLLTVPVFRSPEPKTHMLSSGLQKTDFLPVQTDFYFVKPIQFA